MRSRYGRGSGRPTRSARIRPNAASDNGSTFRRVMRSSATTPAGSPHSRRPDRVEQPDPLVLQPPCRELEHPRRRRIKPLPVVNCQKHRPVIARLRTRARNAGAVAAGPPAVRRQPAGGRARPRAPRAEVEACSQTPRCRDATACRPGQRRNVSPRPPKGNTTAPTRRAPAPDRAPRATEMSLADSRRALQRKHRELTIGRPEELIHLDKLCFAADEPLPHAQTVHRGRKR